MSEPDASQGQRPTEKSGAELAQGEDLLRELSSGWTPLPPGTVWRMVMAGLLVRLSRSVVTMLSIVLAIAFLSYTMLFNGLSQNMVGVFDELAGREAPDPAAVQEAMQTLRDVAVFDAMPVSELRRVGRAWGFSDVLKKRQELSTLTAELREAEKEVINRQNALETLQADEEADEAEITTAERFLRRAEAAVQQLEQRQQTLQQDIAVADWLERDPDVSDQEAEVRSRLSAYKTAIMPQSGLLSELEDVEFAHFRDLMGLLGERVEGGGEQRAYERLQTAAARERDARAASEIRVLLAQGGVDMAAIRSGEDTMGTWLIAMAMLTCTVGIANAMLMSVTERYREIATMKCLGAQDSLVVKLFLLESGLQGIAGAVIGLPVGLGVALMISSVLFGSYGWVYFPWASSMSAILMSLLAGIILAVIGAVGPAIAAARMKPVDALRVEE